MNRICALLSIIFLVAAPLTAGAQTETDRVEKLFAEGAALYRAGKYRAAIAKFDAAYELFPAPTLLYNKGRAHEALGELQDALQAYVACSKSPEVEPQVKRKAMRRARRVRDALRLPTAVPPDVGSTAQGASGPAPQANITTTAAAPSSSSLVTVSKWVTAGLAGALIAAGSVSYALGASDHSTVSDAQAAAGSGVATLTRAEAESLSDDGTTKKTVGVALLGGGLAAAVGSLVLFLVDDEDDNKSTQALGVSPTDDGVAVSWQGSF